MTIVSRANYRLQTITRAIDGKFESVPVSEGLSIEKRCKNSESYYVIMTIKWNCDGYCDIETNNAILDISDFDWKKVRPLIDVGCQIVEIANDFDDEDAVYG